MDDNQKKNVNRVATLVKNKFVQVPVSNKDLLKPGIVVNRVQTALGDPKKNRNGEEIDKFILVSAKSYKKHNLPLNHI